VNKLRIQIPGGHFDPDRLKRFLIGIQKELEKQDIEINNVNIYLALKDENGRNIDLLKDDKVLNFKAKYVKDENGEKKSEIVEWLTDK